MHQLKHSLSTTFKMKDLGELHYCLGINVQQNKDGISFVSKSVHAKTVRNSITVNTFIMAGGAISWLSQKQSAVVLSTSEAEYMALGSATQEAIWLRRLLNDLNISTVEPTEILEDNQGTIAMQETQLVKKEQSI